MPDFSSPNAPFVFIFYLIGLINFLQGTFLSYKYFKGFGAYFPGDQIIKSFTTGKRYITTIPSLIVSPNNATKGQRTTLLVYVILLFLSVFIMLMIAGTLN